MIATHGGEVCSEVDAVCASPSVGAAVPTELAGYGNDVGVLDTAIPLLQMVPRTHLVQWGLEPETIGDDCVPPASLCELRIGHMRELLAEFKPSV